MKYLDFSKNTSISTSDYPTAHRCQRPPLKKPGCVSEKIKKAVQDFIASGGEVKQLEITDRQLKDPKAKYRWKNVKADK